MGTCSQLPCSELSSLGPSWQMIRFEKETRYYTLQLEEDLLGDWVVVTIHGRINSKLGQNKLVAFENFDDAFSHFQKICHIRHQRKYQIASWKKNQKEHITQIQTQQNIPKDHPENLKNIQNKRKSAVQLQQHSFLSDLFA